MAENDTTLTPAAPAPWVAAVLRQPLSTVQTVVGILAGLLTIGGGFLSFSGLVGATVTHQGEIVAVVQDVRSSKPLLQSTVEIFTPEDAIVTTQSLEDGRLSRRLKEGRYRLRVTHPGFLPEVRHVEVHAGQRSDLRISMGPRPPAAARVAKAVVVEEPSPVRKFFKEMFGQ